MNPPIQNMPHSIQWWYNDTWCQVLKAEGRGKAGEGGTAESSRHEEGTQVFKEPAEGTAQALLACGRRISGVMLRRLAENPQASA